MKILPSMFALLLSFAATPCIGQLSLDMSKSFLYAPTGTNDMIKGTHLKLSGVGSYDATFKFNPDTLSFDLDSATPSQTDENTELLAGAYTCYLYNGSQPVFSTTIRPVGHDLIFGAGFQYRFIGTTGPNVWKYTVSFADGGKYLLSLIKGDGGMVAAVLGYLPPGQTELDAANALKCNKQG